MEELEYAKYLSLLIIILATVLLMILIRKTDLIKDQSDCVREKPYSLAKTQLAFWSLIIFSSFVYVVGKMKFIISSDFTLNETALLLLGISGATTILGTTIDSTDQQKVDSARAAGSNPLPRHQDNCSEGFLKDILSDANGISIHRFQNVIFTVMLMVAYVVYVYCSCKTTCEMPDWDATLLTLMGISSAGYLGIKMNENN